MARRVPYSLKARVKLLLLLVLAFLLFLACLGKGSASARTTGQDAGSSYSEEVMPGR